MIIAQATARPDHTLDDDTIEQALRTGLEGRFTGASLLVLIPDHTRSVPLPQLFRLLTSALHDTHRLDFMVALGTHPPLSEEQLCRLVGVTQEERASAYRHVGLLNHTWDAPGALVQIGTLPKEQIQALAGERWHPSLGGDTPININRLVLEYDHILILGPTFPHEVVGFSGGAKYLFPGISGPEMINVTHWLGALAGVLETIGIKQTPVRAMIHAAAEHVPTPITLISLVVLGGRLAGIFIGDHSAAWAAAADLSAERHILWFDRPFQRVLSWAPPMYDELWTGAKAMYKLEPAIADGGEVIVYAPHLDVVSHVHGKYIYEVGYHVLEYFLKQWDRFKHIPLGVLAHSTHLRGAGRFDAGVERARIDVTLATRLPAADCDRLALGYLDPRTIDPDEWRDREADGVLFVPKAGEMLYRVRPSGGCSEGQM
jgi:lactate racemase